MEGRWRGEKQGCAVAPQGLKWGRWETLDLGVVGTGEGDEGLGRREGTDVGENAEVGRRREKSKGGSVSSIPRIWSGEPGSREKGEEGRTDRSGASWRNQELPGGEPGWRESEASGESFRKVEVRAVMRGPRRFRQSQRRRPDRRDRRRLLGLSLRRAGRVFGAGAVVVGVIAGFG